VLAVDPDAAWPGVEVDGAVGRASLDVMQGVESRGLVEMNGRSELLGFEMKVAGLALMGLAPAIVSG